MAQITKINYIFAQIIFFLYFCSLFYRHKTNPIFMRHIFCFIVFFYALTQSVIAQTTVTIEDTEKWTNTELQPYIGKTIQFATPMYVTNNYYSNSLTISPRRIFTPTNQAYPMSAEYNQLLTLNDKGTITLTGVSEYHRIGERMLNLTVKVNSTSSVAFQSCTWSGNSRKDLEHGYDTELVNMLGEASIIVCCMNLEYYLVENISNSNGSMGPNTQAEHQNQRTKVSKALAKINADLYGFVEIEQGQSALKEIASDLTKNTGRNFTYIDDGGSASGTYTKAGYVYCSDLLEPYGQLRNNNTGVSNRKKTQAFIEKATGEKFLFSVNHFKAKSGKGTGVNADKGDGQGSFNGDRVKEAKSVLDYYHKDCVFFNDSDILIMGDLNAYAMEDPITTLRNGGMIDLHRAFHADSSYSYVYRGQTGYLDHALCNSTLYPQVTGMVAYHINSDESDQYTYDNSNDTTMFRCSDHDPVIVGLRLESRPPVSINSYDVYYYKSPLVISNAKDGYYAIYRLDGSVVKKSNIESNEEYIYGLAQGLYIVNIYGQGKCLQTKLIVR